MQNITQIKTLTNQLHPETAGRESTRTILEDKKRQLQNDTTPKGAFERLVECTKNQRLAIAREVADLHDAVNALQRWKAAREDALDEVLSFEREAAQEVIDEIERAFQTSVAQKEVGRVLEVQRVNQEFEAQIRALETDKREQIEQTLGLIGAEPCCDLFKAVGTPDEQDLLLIQQNVKTLKEWAGKETAELVYDSAACGFSHDAFNACFESPNNAVVAITEDGDVYGGFVSVAVNGIGGYVTDADHFIFSLASHRRCAVPQRWAIKSEKQATAVKLFNTNASYFIRFGGGSDEGRLYLIPGRNESFCFNPSESYDGVGDLWLCGIDYDQTKDTGCVTLRRLFVVHLN